MGQPGRGEDQEEGEVGGRLVEHAGRVAHRDAELRGGRDVDVVVSDRDVRHHPEPATRSTGRQHLAVDAIGEQAHDRVELCCGTHELGVGVREVVVAGDELVTRARVAPTHRPGAGG